MKQFLLMVAFFFQQMSSATSWQKLSHLESEGALVSAFVVNLNQGRVISSLNEDLRLSPASVTKLFTGAAALDTFGEGKTLNTEIYMRGQLDTQGVLHGDLIFYGQGDPYLTNEKLWFLATDVARYGIKKVDGHLIVNSSYFSHLDQDESRLKSQVCSKNAYDAPLSSAALNFSVLATVVSPNQKIGAPATLSIEPDFLPSFRLEGHVLTTSPEKPYHVEVSRMTHNGIDTFSVSGHIASGAAPLRIYRSVSNPNLYAGEVLQSFLKHAGVAIQGHLEFNASTIVGEKTLVAQVEGFPLAWQLRGLFEMSNNFIADMWLLQMSHYQMGPSQNSIISAASWLQQKSLAMIQTSKYKNPTPNTTPLAIFSGSGLAPENRLSARDVVSLLDYVYYKNNIFPAFVAALPTPGGIGTLAHRFREPQFFMLKNNLRAKTGTLQEPVDVSSLAGYYRNKSGDWLAFAVIVNGSKKKPPLDLNLLRQKIDWDLSHILMVQ